MSTENKYLPAFPASQSEHNASEIGLTKREYIAAMAMQGIVSEYNDQYRVNDGHLYYPSIAKDAVGMADALLQELSKAPNP